MFILCCHSNRMLYSAMKLFCSVLKVSNRIDIELYFIIILRKMVRINWERIFSLNVSSLTDEEIEDLCPTIMRCNVDEISDIKNLQTLMKISQEMLQYKDNQVSQIRFFVFLCLFFLHARTHTHAYI